MKTDRLPVWCFALVALVAAGCGSRYHGDRLLAATSQHSTLSGAPASSAGDSPAPSGPETPGDTASQRSSVGVAAAGAVPPAAVPSSPPSAAAQPAGQSRAASRAAAAAGSQGGNATQKSGRSAPASRSTPSGSGSAAPAPVAPTPAPAAGAAKAEIRLGSFGVESGPLGRIMLPIYQAAKAWSADVNARGGLAGHPVRLFLADDQGDPNKAMAIVRRMVEEDKVHAIFAPHGITTMSGVLPYLEKVGVPTIGGCPCLDLPYDQSPIAFPILGNTKGMHWTHMSGLLKYAPPEMKKFAIIYCREQGGCARIAGSVGPWLQQTGRELVYKAEASVAQPDYTAEILAAKNAGAEGIIAAMDNASVVRIARTAHRQGWKPIISSQFATYDDRLLSADAADLENIVVSSPTAPYSTSPKMADYRAAIQKYVPGGILSAIGAADWATGKLLEEIAPRLPADPQPRDFIEGLYSLHGTTLGGIVPPLTYRRNQGHGDTNQCSIPAKVVGRQFLPEADDAWSCPPDWKPVTP